MMEDYEIARMIKNEIMSNLSIEIEWGVEPYSFDQPKRLKITLKYGDHYVTSDSIAVD